MKFSKENGASLGDHHEGRMSSAENAESTPKHAEECGHVAASRGCCFEDAVWRGKR